ncbi:helix-turn-helix domain-containing protein [Micromonospora sp. NPDC005806]|uniref:ArsR/SmtB family transcription factor n=1 Tax=Micromonospora sp. NPDC005806 TaxID=3364234 RepID=UPI0036952B37
MLRIHFTAADLARTRIARAPDPLWESVLSMHWLRVRCPDPLLAGWRQRTFGLLHQRHGHRAEVALPLSINPPAGYFPDFLTPIEATGGFEPGLDALLRTPKARLASDLATLGSTGVRLPSAVADLAAGDVTALRQLGAGLQRYYRLAILPLWNAIHSAFDADRALRSRRLLNQGLSALLNDLHPTVRFDGGVLTITDYIAERDLHLDGRGLLLVPCYFKRHEKPMVLADPLLPPVLVYPIHPHARTVSTAAAAGSLSALLGGTRAAILVLAAEGGTTSEIAHRLHISVPSASRHLTVLRSTGLVTSARDRNAVHHTLTPLGLALLNGG